ncbi:hypothetical protein F7725_015831 [Dissostichus mawsoni]|uniref:Uncharacterized protein n=1 Tax=Dissostichus mawsoni TaxID=36200 RepID=A0A7J5YIN0_DISMA|nr:hypothetical protein F7725_015831 [Dissostichus mawsoni]
MEIDDKEEHLERKEEDFIDETDCESGNTRNPGQKQGYSDSSLSSAIDPGITFRPCIALTTEDRVRMFDTRFLTRTCKKGFLLTAVLLCTERQWNVSRESFSSFLSTGTVKHPATTA